MVGCSQASLVVVETPMLGICYCERGVKDGELWYSTAEAVVTAPSPRLRYYIFVSLFLLYESMSSGCELSCRIYLRFNSVVPLS